MSPRRLPTSSRTALASLSFALSATLFACSGGGALHNSRGSSDYRGAPQPAAEADHGGAAVGVNTSPARPRPRERPGLGTQWGENVSSHVSNRQFLRAAGSPFSAVAIHYNDADGVRAHTEHLGSYHLRPLRAYTPQRGVSIALVDPHGTLLPGGEVAGRHLVQGQHGQRYNIVIDNQSGGRYEVLASVDGLDVIDGRPADYAKRGYIVEPHSSLVIDGFRRSKSSVAAFRFGRVSSSYAARTTGDRNVGVVGIAFFAERGSRWNRDWTADELRRRDTANPFPGGRNYAHPPGY